MSKAADLDRVHKEAIARIRKIGAPEPHLQGSHGRVAVVTVQTQICHQAAPSATNYWKDEAFDFALAEVIKARFMSLADEALALMQKKANDALLSEEAALREQLAEIERIKASA